MLKSAQTTVKVTDPLELARKLDKKIIHSNDLIAFIRNHLNEPFTGIDDNRSSDSSNNRRLLPPYIKVLDNSNKYRPNFKELAEWPEINFDYQPELCPFYKPRKPILSNASQQSNKSNTTNNGKNDKFQTVLTTPIMNTTTPTINIKSIPTRNVSKRKHVTFCEICHKEFIDLEKVFLSCEMQYLQIKLSFYYFIYFPSIWLILNIPTFYPMTRTFLNYLV